MNDLVFIKRGQAVCDSLQVAEKFGKRHAEVLYAIEGRPCSCGGNGCSKCNYRGYQQRGLLMDLGVLATSQLPNKQEIDGQQKLELEVCATSQLPKMFKKVRYIHPQNKREYYKYLMNRDGFTLLAMGFTGQEALIWKLKYISAFNTMEQTLLQQQSPLWQDTRSYQKAIRNQETDVIKLFVQYAENQGSTSAERYYTAFSLLANTAAGIEDRSLATAPQLHLLSQIEAIISACMVDGMQRNEPYKSIYTACKACIGQFQGFLGNERMFASLKQ